MPQSSWLNENVALEHRKVAERELAAKELCAPYREFVAIMHKFPCSKQYDLLDIGCGAGAYGVLCDRYFKQIKYMGTDASEHMIRHSRELFPEGNFGVKEFYENNLNHSIILVSGAIQYVGWNGLDWLLKNAITYVILHRVPLTPNRSHLEQPQTYCGNSEPAMTWNLSEIEAFIKDRAHLVDKSIWNDGGMGSFVVRSWASYEY